jgi:hypothetical protein
MTTDTWLNPSLLDGESPGAHRAPGRFRRAVVATRTATQAGCKRVLVAAAKAVVRAHGSRYGIMQLAGGACASVGTFELWGLGVGLLVTGLAVGAASVTLERLSS